MPSSANRRAADGYPESVGLRTAWFHCYAGITGGTALGALIDAGADEVEVRKLVERLPVTGWDISRDIVARIELQTRCVTDIELLELCRILRLSANALLLMSAE